MRGSFRALWSEIVLKPGSVYSALYQTALGVLRCLGHKNVHHRIDTIDLMLAVPFASRHVH